MNNGIIVVSHSKEIAEGLVKLVRQVAKDVPITIAAGAEDGEIGTSFDSISQAVSDNEAETILAFYDLGSAKMNLEMVQETSEKDIKLFNTAFVEGVYNAAALLQVDTPLSNIEEQLESLQLEK